MSEFKPVWDQPMPTFDWLEYSGDGGMITVRKSVTNDAAKFRTKAEALQYIAQQEKLLKDESKWVK